MRHFFPGKDLAPPRSPGWHEVAATARATQAQATGGAPGGGGKRFSLYNRVKAKGKDVVKSAQGRDGRSGGRHFPMKAPNFVSTGDAARRAAMLLHVRPRGHEASPSGAVDLGIVVAEADTTERVGGVRSEHVGVNSKSELQGDLLASRGRVSPRANFGQLLRRATRGEGEEEKAKDVIQAGSVGRVDREENRRETNERDTEQGQERQERENERGEEEREEKEEEQEKDRESEERRRPPPDTTHTGIHYRETHGREAVLPATQSQLSLSSRGHQHGAAASAVDQSNQGVSAATSLLGDNFSTAQLRRKGSLTVYVPHSPNPGVWAASVDYDGQRDVAWVLAEALRMYATEHRPAARYTGLAPRPRLVERSPILWGLFQGNSEWEDVTALPLASPVLSALRPGQELVVLAEGFDPAAAFTRQPSVIALPPASDVASEADVLAVKSGTSGDGIHTLSSSSPPGDYGGAGAPGRDDAASDASRAPSDGARRFPVNDSTGSGSIVPPFGGRETCTRGGGGVGGGDVIALGSGHIDIPRGDLASRAVGTAGRNRAWISEVESSDEEESGSYGEDDDDSLTEEEDEEGMLDDEYGGNPFPRQDIYRSPRQDTYGRPIAGGDTWSRLSGNSSRPARGGAGGVTDASVSTRGLAERCEDDGRASGGSRPPAGPAPGGERRGQQQAERGFPQPRSPPRSLVSAMFTAWGDS